MVDEKPMDTDAPASSAPPPTAQHGVDEVPQDWKLAAADKVPKKEERGETLANARSLPPPLSFSRSLSPHPSVAAFRLPPGNRPGVQGGPAGRDRGGVHGSR